MKETSGSHAAGVGKRGAAGGKKKKKSPTQHDRNRQVATRPSPLVSCFLCSADRCVRRDLLAASFLSPAAAAPGTQGVPCGRMWYQHPEGSETLQKGLLRFPPAPPRWPQATQGVRSPPSRWQLPKRTSMRTSPKTVLVRRAGVWARRWCCKNGVNPTACPKLGWKVLNHPSGLMEPRHPPDLLT